MKISYKRFWKSSLPGKLPCQSHISNVPASVAVAGQKNRAAFLHAGRQKPDGIPAAVFPVAVRLQGNIIQLGNNISFGRCFYKERVIHRKSGIITMTDDAHVWVFHGSFIGKCVFFDGAGRINGAMHADNYIIQSLKNVVRYIEMPLII